MWTIVRPVRRRAAENDRKAPAAKLCSQFKFPDIQPFGGKEPFLPTRIQLCVNPFGRTRGGFSDAIRT